MSKRHDALHGVAGLIAQGPNGSVDNFSVSGT
jgi:hypothetical protein